MPVAPLMLFSIGCVTRTSTCSGERPGASVCTETSGGAKSGNASYEDRKSEEIPYPSSAQASAITIPRKRIEKPTMAFSIPSSAF